MHPRACNLQSAPRLLATASNLECNCRKELQDGQVYLSGSLKLFDLFGAAPAYLRTSSNAGVYCRSIVGTSVVQQLRRVRQPLNRILKINWIALIASETKSNVAGKGRDEQSAKNDEAGCVLQLIIPIPRYVEICCCCIG